MAKYEVERLCGHIEIVNLYGKTKARENRLEWEAKKNCADCYKQKQQQIYARQAELAAQESQEKGLPALIGTPKQVVWAENIRKGIVQEVEGFLERYEKLRESPQVQQFITRLYGKAEAKWWIENRVIVVAHELRAAYRGESCVV